MDKNSFKEVKNCNASDVIYDNYEDLRTKQIRARLKALLKSSFYDSTYSIIFVAVISLSAIYFSTLAYNKTITISNLVLYVTSVSALMQLVVSFLPRIAMFQNISLQYNNYVKFLNIAAEPEDDKLELKIIKSIEFKDVHFKYENQQVWAMEGVSFKINRGENVAIVGHNGAGKTTLVNLLMGFYTPQKGEICINGINIKEYKKEHIHKCFANVFQQFEIFGTLSLKDNIGFNKIDDAKIVESLKKVGLYDKIKNDLKGGLDSKIDKRYDDDAIELSGGELQKIAIARAISKEFEVLVCDEPSSKLDPISESELIDLIEDITRKKTGIIISHKLSSVKNVDRILHFKKGKLIEEGSHEDLVKKDGEYAFMYNLQSSKYSDDEIKAMV